MRKLFRSSLIGSVLVISGLQIAAASNVEVKTDEAKKRVDVTIDGKPFTAYVWPSTLKKPVLFPLIAADGVTVTRGYPLAPRDTERVDHPHHAGVWFNYGNANGFDFWNNSDAIKPEQQPHMGTILHKRVVEAKSGKDSGSLTVETEWVKPDNTPLLKEDTQFVFRGDADSRTIDRTSGMSGYSTPRPRA